MRFSPCWANKRRIELPVRGIVRRGSRGRLLGTLIVLALTACAAGDVPPPLEADLVVVKALFRWTKPRSARGRMNRSPWQTRSRGPGARGSSTFRAWAVGVVPNAAIELRSGSRRKRRRSRWWTCQLDRRRREPTRLTLETSSSIIRTLDPATRFTACQPATGNACVVVKRDGSSSLCGPHQDLRSGQGNFTEAAFIIKGQAPGRDMRSQDEFDSWFDEARVNEEFQPLESWWAGSSACDAEPPELRLSTCPARSYGRTPVSTSSRERRSRSKPAAGFNTPRTARCSLRR